MKFGWDVLIDGEWHFLYNLQPHTIRDAFNWACAMGGITGANGAAQYDAIRLVRLENNVQRE